VTNDPGKGKGKEKPLPESKFDSDISQFKDIQAESVSINTSAVGSSSSRFDEIRTAAKRWKSWFEKD
jgi:hypothetical protein